VAQACGFSQRCATNRGDSAPATGETCVDLLFLQDLGEVVDQPIAGTNQRLHHIRIISDAIAGKAHRPLFFRISSSFSRSSSKIFSDGFCRGGSTCLVAFGVD
jgi:hypothetical protein